MKLSYNVTGSERKRLAAAMGGILGSEPKYLGAPSFAYEVGCFTVDKNGAVTFDEQADSEKVQNLIERLREQGFAAAEAETKHEDIGLTIEMPLEGFTDESIANLEKLIAGKATLIKKAIGVNTLPVERTETTLRFPWFSDGDVRYGAQPEARDREGKRDRQRQIRVPLFPSPARLRGR